MNASFLRVLAKTSLTAMAAAVALALTSTAASAAAAGTSSDVPRAAIGLKVAPVPLNMRGLDKNMVGLGSYLVTVATCSGCHSNPEFAPGSNPFNGDPTTAVVQSAYLAGGVNFGPGFCSANITPDSKGRPAGLTLAQFVSAMRTGHDFRDPPGDLLQVMPWPYFRYLTTSDLSAIYAYLQAIPSNRTPPCP
jgi:hypothetical protein